MTSTPKNPYKDIEGKWQQKWREGNVYVAKDNDSSRQKKYILMEFPFPSGSKLHIGHIFRYTAPDVYSRFLRMRGYNVLFPMGWDAFGLPTEEFARKTGIPPVQVTEQNIDNFREQMISLGYSFDWNREFSTTDPEYFKWTQWIFTELYKAGLAEQKEVELWWCEKLATVLANEEIIEVNGQKVSERGEHPVEKKKMTQWVLKMPEYAEELLDGLNETEFPEHIKEMQRNWIGRSEGVVVDWELVPEDYPLVEDGQQHELYFERKKEDESLQVVSVIIENSDGQFLICKRSMSDSMSGFWEFPGGVVEYGETFAQAAKREVREEVGITLQNLDFVQSYSFTLKDLTAQAHIFHAISDTPVQLNEEHDEYVWVYAHEIAEILHHTQQISAFQTFLEKRYPVFSQSPEDVDFKIPYGERGLALIRVTETNQFVVFDKSIRGDKRIRFPGGHIDPGETALGATIREVQEEVGLEGLQLKAKLGVCHGFYSWAPEDKIIHKFDHFFYFECSLQDWERRVQGMEDDKHCFLVDSEYYLEHATEQGKWVYENMQEYIRNRVRVVMATHNPSKVARNRKYIQVENVEPASVQDLGISVPEPEENGANEWENAKIKAKAYYEATQLPALSIDTGFYIQGLTEQEQPARHVQRIAGVVESDSPEQKYDKMIAYYSEIASRFGGEVKAYFLDQWCLYDGKEYYGVEAKREVTLTNTINQKDVHFPICSLYKVDDIYYHDLTSEQMTEYLAPSFKLATSLIQNSLDVPTRSKHLQTFTTRVDTIYSVTFLVVAPEHPLLKSITHPDYKDRVEHYIKLATGKSDLERQIGKEKTGVFTGRYVYHPLTGEKIPVWVSDFVLPGYGTGCVMADGHDIRDVELAQKYDIPLKESIAPEYGEEKPDEQFRSGVCVALFDPKTQLYGHLVTPTGAYGIIGGGDDGMPLSEAAIKEAEEEAGIDPSNIHKLIELPGLIYAHYYNAARGVARKASVKGFLVVTDSEKQGQQRLESHENFVIEWHTPEEIIENMMAHSTIEVTREHYVDVLRRAVYSAIKLGLDTTRTLADFTPKVITDDGILYNSEEFDGLSSTDAREKIAQKLETMGMGKKQINYRFRDWVFSRQRYWGEPFPVEYIKVK